MAENDLQERLKTLREHYAANLPKRLGQIEQAWEELSTHVWNEEDLRSLQRMVHNLTGSGKTFGFDLLSEVARKLEDSLQPFEQPKTAPNDEQRNRIRILLSELHQVTLQTNIAAESAWFASAQPVKAAASLATEEEADYWCPVSGSRIFVVEDDPAFAELLRVQLSYFGYEVSVFGKLADFRSAMRSKPDVVVLMDVTFPESRLAGIATMKVIQQGRGNRVPVIFMSAHDDFTTRLESARAGGIAYFSKPVNIDSLIDKLDKLTSPFSPVPYRIMIVDDSLELTAYYVAVLEQAGMTVRVVNNPLEVMAPLLDFTPDLILLDMYMPGCNGMELAKVIRLLEPFVSIPIVFLSAESDLDKQFFAMNVGGDDFLVKPIQPHHLISAVSSRVRRSLQLRSFMIRDSLTGLLNHTATIDQLAREVARAKRQGTPISFAMVDIDHFKKVNDIYGHAVGDQVIKSLSLLLKQRLRKNDSVGRYGGEEFAVILGDTDGASAVRVLDSIRHDFSQLHHVADGRKFAVTFSCGVADELANPDAVALSTAADKALYQAKHAGRNQVILAPP